MPSQRVHHAFIVRIWAETTENADQLPWRGQVEHFPSGGKYYFAALDDLTNFIHQYLAHPSRLTGSLRSTPPDEET